MRSLFLSGLAFAILSSGVANADTLRFDDLFENVPDLLALGAEIDPSYGDTETIDVDSALHADFGDPRKADQPVVFYSRFQGQGYGQGAPSGVAIASVDGAVGEFSFTAKNPGDSITLGAFDTASFPNGEDTINGGFAIFDQNLNLLWSQIIPVGGAVQTIEPNITAVGALYFQWGTSFNIGVDNIVYSASPTPPVGAVPLPATLPLLVGGLGLIGLARRRKSAIPSDG